MFCLNKSDGAQQIETLLKRPLSLTKEAYFLYQSDSFRYRNVQTASNFISSGWGQSLSEAGGTLNRCVSGGPMPLDTSGFEAFVADGIDPARKKITRVCSQSQSCTHKCCMMCFPVEPIIWDRARRPACTEFRYSVSLFVVCLSLRERDSVRGASVYIGLYVWDSAIASCWHLVHLPPGRSIRYSTKQRRHQCL